MSIFGLPNIFKNFFNIGVFQFAGLLLQLLAIPLITRKYGLEVFGEIALATSFAYLLGNIVNYGTNQTEIKKISVYRDDNEKLSNVFFNTFWLRVLVFLAIITFTTIVLIILQRKQITLWLSITPFLFAEILNPIYFLIGIEKMHWISWGNVITRIFSFILILLTTINSYQSFALNLFMGLPLLVFYLIVVLFLIRKFRIKIRLPYFDELKAKVVHNFQVTFNGNIGMLQQSIFLFFVAGNFNTSVLGAYGIVDKLLNAIRQVVSAFSTAIYPRGAVLFHESKFAWLGFRSMIQKIYFWGSVLLGLLLYFFADQIVLLISSEKNQLASDFIKLLAPASLFLSLNANNILDFLLNEQYKGMFRVSIFILISTIVISYTLSSNIFNLSIGLYPVLIEASCFLIYSIAVKKYKLHAI